MTPQPRKRAVKSYNLTLPETDTPETDAEEWASCDGQGTICGMAVDSDFARKLERQRNDLIHEMKEHYNLASFDWDTMPEAGKRKFREIVFESADRALTNPFTP